MNTIKRYFRDLKDAYSLRFLLFLVCTQLFVKGSLIVISSNTLLPIFKAMNMDAVHVQLYLALAMSPWSIKPVIGVLSDTVATRGYHKRYYLVTCICIGIGAGISLIFIPHEIRLALLLVVAFFGLNYQISVCDLLSEGTYSKMMNTEHGKETGTSIITFVNGLQTAGNLLALCFVGPLSDLHLFYPIFIIGAVLSFSPLIPTLLGWLPEEREERRHQCVKINTDKINENRLAFLIIFLTGLAAPVLAFLTIYVSHIIGVLCALLIISLSVTGAYIAFPTKLIGHVALFQVISSIGRPSLSSAMDFFYTADEKCLPGGPNFSFKYYITYTGILGAAITFVAVWIYQKWLSSWKLRNVLIFTAILRGLGGITDLLMVLRVNIELGINDKMFYILGEAIIENTVAMLNWIPSSAIIAKVCTPGMETATFAFLAGISNFGGMTSGMLGAVIFKMAGIKTTVGQCNFNNLWILVLICHIILPIITGIGASFLIPNLRQDQDLLHIEEDNEQDTELVELDIDINSSEIDDNSEFYVEF